MRPPVARRHPLFVLLALLGATVFAIALVGRDAPAGAGTTPATGDGSDQIDLDQIGSFDSPVHIAFAPGAPDNIADEKNAHAVNARKNR